MTCTPPTDHQQCNYYEIILQEGVYDADVHIDLLDSAIAEGGRNCIVLCDAMLPPVKMGNFSKILDLKLNSRNYFSNRLERDVRLNLAT